MSLKRDLALSTPTGLRNWNQLGLFGLGLLSVLLGGCASSSSGRGLFVSKISVDAVSRADCAGKTFSVFGITAQVTADMRFQEIASHLTPILKSKGMVPVENPDATPDLAVLLVFEIGNPNQRVSQRGGSADGRAMFVVYDPKVQSKAGELYAQAGKSAGEGIAEGISKYAENKRAFIDKNSRLAQVSVLAYDGRKLAANAADALLWDTRMSAIVLSEDIRVIVPWMLKSAGKFISGRTDKRIEVAPTRSE